MPRVFISYARNDGEDFAKQLRERLEREEPEITLWRDREEMVGGVGWWKQITEAIEAVEFMVLVMTPAAVASDICRKEWRYARQQGVCVVPVQVPDQPLDYDALPKWMSTANFMDLDHQWQLFTNQLKSPCQQNRVSFMAPDLPEGFVERPKEFDELIHQVLDTESENPVAITTALQGAGGFGKTTLATALCYDDRVISAFVDGILWVTLGETPNVQDAITKLYAALTGERPGFRDEEDAANSLDERLADKQCLIVIDDVWNAAHLRPLLRGGRNCTRLITTRRFDIAAAEATPVLVDEMTSDEATQLLGHGLAQSSPHAPREEPRHAERDDYTADALASLAARLGEWPLMLELAAATIRKRQKRGQSIKSALEYVNTALDRRGVTALDAKDAVQRKDAVVATMGLSLEELREQEQTACRQLAIFPEDIDVPLSAVAALWEMDEFDAETLAEQLADRAFFRFKLEAGTLRLHDVVRKYLGEQLSDASALHGRVVDRWSSPEDLPDDYAWRWYAYHLRQAERQEELRARLADFHWLEAKLRASDVNSLITDFDYIDDLDWLRLVQDALQMSAHVLSSDADHLPSQLLGRLCGLVGAYPDLRPLIEQIEGLSERTWLRPKQPTLVSALSPLMQTLEGHTDWVNAVAITPDGARAVSASEDHTLKVWDLASGREEKTLEGHSSLVRAVAITPDGARAVSASRDHTLKVWDLAGGREEKTLQGQRIFVSVAITPDGARAVSTLYDGTLKVWDLASGRKEKTLERHTDWVRAVAITPDGARAVSASRDKTLKVWDLASGREEKTLEGHSSDVIAVAITPDGARAVSASDDHTLKVWDLASGHEEKTLLGHSRRVNSVAITPDGARAVSASEDKTLKVWELASGREEKTLEGHTNFVHAVGITPDGARAVSGSGDKTLKVWELASGREEKTLEGHTSYVNAVAITPDGARAVSASEDKALKVWDLASGREKKTLEGHKSSVRAVGITPDGARAVSASEDKTLKVWDLASGQVVASFAGEGGQTALAVSPDGFTIVAGEEGGRIHFLRLIEPES